MKYAVVTQQILQASRTDASPEWWFSVLTGNPNATPDTHFYRYFKRDTLTPAIAEINAIAKIHVELLEHKGRKVLEIQFAIMISAQTSLVTTSTGN